MGAPIGGVDIDSVLHVEGHRVDERTFIAAARQENSRASHLKDRVFPALSRVRHAAMTMFAGRGSNGFQMKLMILTYEFCRDIGRHDAAIRLFCDTAGLISGAKAITQNGPGRAHWTGSPRLVLQNLETSLATIGLVMTAENEHTPPTLNAEHLPGLLGIPRPAIIAINPAGAALFTGLAAEFWTLVKDFPTPEPAGLGSQIEEALIVSAQITRARIQTVAERCELAANHIRNTLARERENATHIAAVGL
ncbi:Uncharacterised protein [Mycobacteroides abscessus subsp. bolletii]|nr:Uncharacterised protein [Mycobacteroides abscessus subsp. abscessus]SKU94515.1 Uncharacterised protein [Mycobacteroides abscessus subsp. bolletii]